MDEGRQQFFENHPDPMWVYDRDTQAILDVNEAALRRYGFSRAEFLGMTYAQLSPEEDAAAAQPAAQFTEARVIRHRLKSGEIISAEVTANAVNFAGRKAELVAARDVTRLVRLEERYADALAREAAARQASDRLAQRFQSLFAAVPGKFMVLAPDGFEILAVSDAFLAATGTLRENLIGHPLFGAFPQDQTSQVPDGEVVLRASLDRVIATRQPDTMGVRPFPVRRPASEGGGLEERHWAVTNAPVLGADGSIAYIFHNVEDVTKLVRLGSIELQHIPALLEPPGAFDLALRTRELKHRTLQLEEQVAELRAAQQLLAMATWTLDSDGRLAVSGNFHQLLGTTAETFVPTLAGYVALVHPDDQEATRASLATFSKGGASHYQLRHRLIRPADGRTLHVMVVGEFRPGVTDTLTCIVQDITALVEATHELSKMAVLTRIAGRAARLGGWRYDMPAARLSWDAQTYEIYELPLSAAPDMETAFASCLPEFRDRILAVCRRCMEAGEPFDETVQLRTRTGRDIWVRVIGEAERNEAGAIVALQGAVQDVDEIVRAHRHAESLARTLAATLESISDAFATIDESWRFTFVNSQAEKLLDRQRGELIDRNIWETYPEAVDTPFYRAYQQAMHTGETSRVDQFYPPLGMRLRATVYRVPEGIAVYFSDVTRQHEQESQLRLLQAAVARMSDILLITDAQPVDGPEGPRIVYVNEAFERRTGFSREEAIGRTPRILQGPDTQRAELQRIHQALQRQQPVRSEVLNYTKGGEELWLELDIVPIADEDGVYTHWVSVDRDVTERRKTEALSRINNERFRLIAKATNDVVWDWDLLTGTLWWNESVRTLFGYVPEALEPGVESWTTHIHPEDRDRVLRDLHGVVEGGESTWISEYRFLHADGRALTVIDRGYVIRDDAGKPLRMIGSMVDVTERMELDAQLRQSQKLEAVGHLTGGVAHDFNNLLTVILGNAALLTESLADAPALRALAEMTEAAATRGAELINRMLAFSRRQALDPKVIDVQQLIAGMEGLFRRTLPEDIELQFRGQPGLWLTEVDTSQLESALLNLVVNARDAMASGGRLTIETAKADLDAAYARHHHEVIVGQYVKVSVADSGTGMSAAVLQRVFDPFFTTKEVGRGSGLGLSMVYGFVKQSRGHIQLHSEPGTGTTVELYFPRALSAAGESPEQARSPRLPRGLEHLLVVEDDELVRKYVVGQLRGLGYRVTHAENGQRALELLPQLPAIALLFTDVVMPGGMSGRDLAREVVRLRPQIKVLFTSGYTEDVMHDGRLDPGVHLLRKPYRREDLADKVRRVLDAPAG